MTADPNQLLRDRINEGVTGVYELTEELGQGGMAVVFLARDIKHERAVAVKVLREEVASRVGCERFLQEIKTTATLVHPHVLSLIDSGEVAGIPYYVMPYITGESLAVRLTREKQLPLKDALKITADVAAALDYAHRSGFVHRDVKPANILLHDGEALVADFGVALALEAAGGERLTGTGFAVGTPQYMSPEQAAADRELDARSDIYSLGAVLYEMLAGEPPHSGPTVHAVLAKVLSERPTSLGVVRDIPKHVEAVVNKALSKSPSDRYETCSEFVTALMTPESIGGRSWKPASRQLRRVLAFGVPGLAVVLGVVAVLLAGVDRPSPAIPDPITRQITFTGNVQEVSLAPDGEMICYLADDRLDLTVRDLASDREIRILEAETPLGSPRWNATGTSLLVAGEIGGDHGLHVVPRLGGESRLVVAFSREGTAEEGRPRPPAGRGERMRPFALGGYDFTADGSGYLVACCGGRVFLGGPGSVIRALSPDSFTAQGGRFLATDEEMLQVSSLSASPDGDWVAFLGATSDQQVVLEVTAIDGTQTNVVAALGGMGSVMTVARTGAVRWPEPGETIFFSRQLGAGTNVLAIPFDARRGVAIGQLRSARSGLPPDASFDVSPSSNRFVYAGGPRRAQLELVTPDGGPDRSRSSRITEGTWLYSSPSISPDGESVAYLKGNGVDSDIYRRPVTGGAEERLTHSGNVRGFPAWSPDGSRIAFAAALDEGVSLNVLDLATGETRQVGDGQIIVEGRPQWSPDGARLLYRSRPLPGDAQSQSPGSVRVRPRLLALDLATGSESEFTHPGFFGLANPVFSPDGSSFVALGVGDVGERRFGLWVIPIEGDAAVRLVEGAALPLVWSGDGWIYFIRDLFGSADGKRIERVPASGGSAELHMALPSTCELGGISISLDGSKVICTVIDVESDVWLVDFFQPDS